VADIISLQEKHIMSSSLPPISQSNVSFVNAHIEGEGDQNFNSFKNKFSKESQDYYNNLIDGQDPQDLATQIHCLMKITSIMGDEYKEMYPH
jgi:hypothetical protein